MKPCRILIADDHELMRRGLRNLLEAHQGWEICAEAASGWEAVQFAVKLKPDIVIMDISMPQLNGLEATRQIVKAVPATEVLVLTVHHSEEMEREALAAGARGYILKTDESSEVVTAVEQLCRHHAFFTADVTRMVVDDFVRHRAPEEAGEIPSAEAALTSRERQITQLLAEGRSNKEVATNLGISLKTVECHRCNIFRKLDIHNLSDLVHYAIRNRLVEP